MPTRAQNITHHHAGSSSHRKALHPNATGEKETPSLSGYSVQSHKLHHHDMVGHLEGMVNSVTLLQASLMPSSPSCMI